MKYTRSAKCYFSKWITESKLSVIREFIKEMNDPAGDRKTLTIDECLEIWGHPTTLGTSLGVINRVDGCSWLMTKKDWETYGPLPVLKAGITGDVLIHDYLQRAGYTELMVRDCVTYHFVQGESGNW